MPFLFILEPGIAVLKTMLLIFERVKMRHREPWPSLMTEARPAVELAVKSLEDNESMNALLGSNLTVDRFAECDATDEKEYERKRS